jgi:hypothetical protein
MKRLLDFAREATKGKADAINDFRDLGLKLGESSATITNWKSRGVSRDGALKAERMFGCAASWILDGKGERGEPQEVEDPMQTLALLTPDEVYDLMMTRLKDVEKLADSLLRMTKKSGTVQPKTAENAPGRGGEISSLIPTPPGIKAHGNHPPVSKKAGSRR